MELSVQLSLLEDTGLIRQALTQPDLSYLFKHVLVQDVVYTSLLRQDRRELHLAIGEVLEKLTGNRIEENAAMLAYHFREAGDKARACRYYQLAGDQAMRQYAIPEALMQYNQAIDQAGSQDASLPVLYRMRGSAHESLGQFESARADHERALQIAMDQGDNQAAWRSLLDLGMLWAGRDYTRTGEYYQRAYEQARLMRNDANLAHALNHLGNWYVNLDRPGEGVKFHLQALDIFERMHDEPSMATTLDFLGIASLINGNTAAGKEYYQRAISLFRRVGDLVNLSSSLATYTCLSAVYFVVSCPPSATVPEVIGSGYEALQIARQILRPDAETYALLNLAECHGSLGEYSKAWQYATQGLAIALEIGHRQWLCFAHLMVGKLLADLVLYERARPHLDQSLKLAEELGSVHFSLSVRGFMVSLFVHTGELAQAQAILYGISPDYLKAETAAQRLVMQSQVELALAQGNPQVALEIIDLLDQTKGIQSPQHISWLVACLRGRALTILRLAESAEVSLQAAYREALVQTIRPAQQQILVALAQLRELQGRNADADQRRAEAQKLADEMAFIPPE